MFPPWKTGDGETCSEPPRRDGDGGAPAPPGTDRFFSPRPRPGRGKGGQPRPAATADEEGNRLSPGRGGGKSIPPRGGQRRSPPKDRYGRYTGFPLGGRPPRRRALMISFPLVFSSSKVTVTMFPRGKSSLTMPGNGWRTELVLATPPQASLPGMASWMVRSPARTPGQNNARSSAAAPAAIHRLFFMASSDPGNRGDSPEAAFRPSPRRGGLRPRAPFSPERCACPAALVPRSPARNAFRAAFRVCLSRRRTAFPGLVKRPCRKSKPHPHGGASSAPPA